MVEVCIEKLVASEVERECYSQLIDCLSENHFPHGQGKQ